PETLPLAATVRRLTTGLGTALDLSDAMAERLARRFVDDTTGCVRSNIAILSDLARRYHLGIVSNFYGNLASVCEDLGLRSLFGVIVDSAAVGFTKPDPRIFTRALDDLGVQAADATFVGDSLSRDMAGARDIGMAHIWLAAEAAPQSRPCCPGDRVIHSLAELRGLLLRRRRCHAGGASSPQATGLACARRATPCPSRWCPSRVSRLSTGSSETFGPRVSRRWSSS